VTPRTAVHAAQLSSENSLASLGGGGALYGGQHGGGARSQRSSGPHQAANRGGGRRTHQDPVMMPSGAESEWAHSVPLAGGDGGGRLLRPAKGGGSSANVQRGSPARRRKEQSLRAQLASSVRASHRHHHPAVHGEGLEVGWLPPRGGGGIVDRRPSCFTCVTW
jgi:hypothetical protein